MEIKVIIKDPIGLHARPASVMVQEANKFESELTISVGKKTGNLKSIMSVMALGVRTNDEIILSAEGEDADEALKCLKNVMIKNKVI